MAILRVRDEKGNVIEIPAIKGDKGDKGDKGAGVYVGTYVGDGNVSTRYIDLGSANVLAVLLSADDNNILPTVVVMSGDGVTVNGQKVAWLVDAYANETVDIAVMHDANKEGVTYRYIAFIE